MARYIDADALYMDVIRRYDDCDDFLEMIETALTANVRENVHGEWIEQDDAWDGVYYECSCCKEPFTFIDGTPVDNLYNFCPNCGADMRKGEKNDNQGSNR